MIFRHFKGHINIGKRITIYGDNAMHYAINVYTRRFGYICFRPTTRNHECPDDKWKWYLFCSPNGTPWASTFAIGDIDKKDKRLAPIRRVMWGHNFDTDEYRYQLRALNHEFEYWLQQEAIKQEADN